MASDENQFVGGGTYYLWNFGVGLPLFMPSFIELVNDILHEGRELRNRVVNMVS